MKKIIVSLFFLLGLLGLFGCTNTGYIRSRPVGYAIVSTDYAAQGSFSYNSKEPFSLNNVTLTLNLMPHIWGEINSVQASALALNDPDFVVFEETVQAELTKRAFVKHIMINQNVWTANLDNDKISYKNNEGLDFVSYLEDQENVKEYIEAIEMGQAYFLNHELVMLTNYQSKYDDGETMYQRNARFSATIS
jgi:hypothetical protein